MGLQGYNFDFVEGDWARLREIIDELGNVILDTQNTFSDFLTNGVAITCTSLDAGSGTIETTGELKGGITTVGALSATSVDAGSGTIETTGAVRGTTVEAVGALSGDSLAVTNAITCGSLSDGTATLTGGNYSSAGTIISGNITILSPTPILVFQDSNSLGAASVGYIEWRDSGGGRAGFLGNNSAGNSDLFWKNEQGGDIGIQTTGAGKIQLFSNTELNGNSITGVGVIECSSVDAGAGTIETTGALKGGTTTVGAIACSSVNAGAGTIETTGALKGGATTVGAIGCSSVNAGAGTIETTGALKGGTTTVGAIGCTAVNAGAGTIETTGSGSFGAISGSSLNAGSGLIETLGAIEGATITASGTLKCQMLVMEAPATLPTDSTPSVSGRTYWNSTGTTGISDFDDGVEGQIIIITQHTNNRVVQDNANIVLTHDIDFTMGGAAHDTLTLILGADNIWHEIGRKRASEAI